YGPGINDGGGPRTIGTLNDAIDNYMKRLTDGCTPAADNGCFKVTRTYTRCFPKAGIPPPPNAIANSPQPAQTCSSPSNPSISGSQAGSQIDCRDRTLRQSIPIVGTDFSLNYSSRETQGAGPVNNSFSVLVSPNEFSPNFGNITTISVTVLILDQTLNQVFTINAPRFNELQANFEWNGKNKAGTLVSGVQKAKVTISYNFQRSYLSNTPIKLT
ncbi:MAG: hypothetical protein NTX25_10870, partial [Proteobacteria bacterium]|nr:hypothetical protein [Pseudomonadota bacterium]